MSTPNPSELVKLAQRYLPLGTKLPPVAKADEHALGAYLYELDVRPTPVIAALLLRLASLFPSDKTPNPARPASAGAGAEGGGR